jgi:hypothetical protein
VSLRCQAEKVVRSPSRALFCGLRRGKPRRRLVAVGHDEREAAPAVATGRGLPADGYRLERARCGPNLLVSDSVAPKPVDVGDPGQLYEYHAERAILQLDPVCFGVGHLAQVATRVEHREIVYGGERTLARHWIPGLPADLQLGVVRDLSLILYDRRFAPDLLDEDPHDPGVQLRSCAAFQFRAGFVGLTGAVEALRDHRAERVGHADDPRLQGDLLSAQPRRVAAAVEVLVVEDGRGDGAQRPYGLHEPVAEAGMLLHHGAFLNGQRGRLEEDALAYPDLPDVVQQRAEDQLFAPGGRSKRSATATT